MRRILLLLLAMSYGIGIFSQTLEANQIFDTFRGEKDVVSVYIPGFACRLASNLADLEPEERKLLKSIKSIHVQVIENREINESINLARIYANRQPTVGYFPMLEVHDGTDDVLILGREKDDLLSELLILVGGKGNVMVWIKGRMDRDLMQSLYEVTGIKECRYTREI